MPGPFAREVARAVADLREEVNHAVVAAGSWWPNRRDEAAALWIRGPHAGKALWGGHCGVSGGARRVNAGPAHAGQFVDSYLNEMANRIR